MFELTDNGNQTEEMVMNDDYLLPEGVTEDDLDSIESVSDLEKALEGERETEETEEDSVNIEEEDNETEETEENTIDFEEMEVNYLKNKQLVKDIPFEKRIELMQRGMNQERYENHVAKDKDTVNRTQLVADLFNMDIDSMLNTLVDQHLQRKADEENRNINDVRKEFESNNKSINDKMLERFLDAYPDIDTKNLPEDVLSAVKNGGDMLDAYKSHLTNEEISTLKGENKDLQDKIAKLEKQLKVKKQNAKSKKKGVVTKTTDSGVDNKDDFLSGLLG